ncbi:hypothetical protein HCN44_009430 [Aphidius gifuensis]|uniref:ATP-dependent RNA helicase n=1 Tax=Aphidius gifuensis TaxID=684658 RepID=A0A834Y7D5_APHGI|nr:hypothetical protein HCN44_009430 [Aphidius gifuensis]
MAVNKNISMKKDKKNTKVETTQLKKNKTDVKNDKVLKKISNKVIDKKKSKKINIVNESLIENSSDSVDEQIPIDTKIDVKEEINFEGTNIDYVFCQSDKKFLLLNTFIKKNRNKKIVIFLSSDKSIEYHQELFFHLEITTTSILETHNESKRKYILSRYCKSSSGVLLCTHVSIKDLELPIVDLTIQFDPPNNPVEYLQRIKVTKNSQDKNSQALLFLHEKENEFVNYLQSLNVHMDELKYCKNHIADIQPQIEKLVKENYILYTLAREAYKSFMRVYDSNSMKNIFNVEQLDIAEVAKSYGFIVPPAFDLKVGADDILIPEKRLGGGGFGYLRKLNNPDSVKRNKTITAYRQIKRKNKKSNKKLQNNKMNNKKIF